MGVGSRYETARRTRNLTRRQLSERLGIPREDVRSWEAGLSCPDEVTLKRLAVLLGVSRDYLIHDDMTDPCGDPLPTEETARQIQEAAGRKVRLEYWGEETVETISPCVIWPLDGRWVRVETEESSRLHSGFPTLIPAGYIRSIVRLSEECE